MKVYQGNELTLDINIVLDTRKMISVKLYNRTMEINKEIVWMFIIILLIKRFIEKNMWYNLIMIVTKRKA